MRGQPWLSFMSACPVCCEQCIASQLQEHAPEELTFVVQKPMTMGGLGDLMQVTLPKAKDRMPREGLATVGAGLFVLS